jgi:hypothetical protein
MLRQRLGRLNVPHAAGCVAASAIAPPSHALARAAATRTKPRRPSSFAKGVAHAAPPPALLLTSGGWQRRGTAAAWRAARTRPTPAEKTVITA